MNGAFQGTAISHNPADIMPGAPAGALYTGHNNNYFRSIENINETTITSNLAEEFLNTGDDDFGGGKQAQKRSQIGQRECFNDTQHSKLNPFLSQNNITNFQSTGLRR